MIQEISKSDFRKTMTAGMTDITATAKTVTDIWNYVEQLVELGVTSSNVFVNNLIEKIYRTNDKKYDHILLPTDKENYFLVLIIDINDAIVRGHYLSDLPELYR